MSNNVITLERENNVAFFVLDNLESQLNLLNEHLLFQLENLVKQIEADHTISSVVIISNKENNFIAGADIHALLEAPAEVAMAMCRRAQMVFEAMEKSRKIYVAAIHGSCFGGGLELALACDYRIASLDAKTKLGLPEITLGILPAAGGTQRLPRIVGFKNAVDMMLKGSRIVAKRAKKIGLVDATVNMREELKPASLLFLKTTQSKKLLPKRLPLFWLPLLWFSRRAVMKKTSGLYPAPLSILHAIEVSIIKGLDAGFKTEVQELGKLSQTSISKNLVRLFFLQKARQKNPFTYQKNSLKHVGIVGSGLMGTGIGYVSLLNNFIVHLFDNNEEALAHAHAFIENQLLESREKGISQLEINRLRSNLFRAHSLGEFSQCDAVIEAIVEDVSAKTKLVSQLESTLKATSIFATNTSSIPLKEIAKDSAIKDRIVGMHYFSPAHKMPLLEIVRSNNTSDETLAKACEIGVIQKKTLIVVNDSPGFYTTRVISALFDEAAILVAEHYSPQLIDKSLLKIGFPMGPLSLMDEIGLDVGFHVSKILRDAFGTRLIAEDSGLTEGLITRGFLGRKSGRGFYEYDDKNKKINKDLVSLLSSRSKVHDDNIEKIQDRMLLRMVNEAAYCLSENIIQNEEDGDVGAVFGIGFPAHLGGPFAYIHARGKDVIRIKLELLTNEFGIRFTTAKYFH